MASVTPRPLKSGQVRWRVQVRVNGQMKQTTFLDKKGADQFAAHIEKFGWASAKAVLESRRERRHDTPTLREYTERYLDPQSGLLTGVEDGTRDGYRAEADRSYLGKLGDYPIDVITRADVGSWLAWQERQPAHRDRDKPVDEQKPVSAKTVRNYHALLSAVFKSAVGEGIRPDNPAFKVRVTRGTKREAVFLSPAEFSTLLKFVPEQHRRFVLFLAGTGLRWGEATAVTWGDIDLHSNTPVVHVTRSWKKATGGPELKYPKTSRSRRSVSLYPNLVAALGEPGAADELVFPNQTGGHLWHGTFNTRVWQPAVRAATDAASCEDLLVSPIRKKPTIHDMRHTHASWLIAQGIPLPYIQARLGHESIKTTVDVYGHLLPEAHDQMASAMATTLSGL